MTLLDEFQAIPTEIFDEFESLVKVATFKLGGGVHPVTGAVVPPTTEDVDILKDEFSANQVDGQAIQSGDIKLIADAKSFSSITPTVSGLKVTLEGVDYEVIRAMIDGADAAWVMQVRAL